MAGAFPCSSPPVFLTSSAETQDVTEWSPGGPPCQPQYSPLPAHRHGGAPEPSAGPPSAGGAVGGKRVQRTSGVSRGPRTWGKGQRTPRFHESLNVPLSLLPGSATGGQWAALSETVGYGVLASLGLPQGTCFVLTTREGLVAWLSQASAPSLRLRTSPTRPLFPRNRRVQWLEWCLLHGSPQVHVPSNCECDCIWKKGVCRCDDGEDLERRVSPKSSKRRAEGT